jgi:hypothetical protein
MESVEIKGFPGEYRRRIMELRQEKKCVAVNFKHLGGEKS